MPAQVIFRNKDAKFDINKAVEEVIGAITAQVVVEGNRGGVVQVELKAQTVGHGFRPFGDNSPGDYIDLSIVVGKTKIEGLGRNDFFFIGDKVVSWAKARGCDVEMMDVRFGFDPFRKDGEFPKCLRFFSEGCDEFKELQHLVMRDGIDLNVKDLYMVRLFGKRGRYDESGERSYTAYDPIACRHLIKLVKENNVKVEVIDDVEDLDLSIRYEIECYGLRKVTLVAA